MRVCRLLLVHSDYSAELIQERYRFPRVIKKIRHPSYVECYRNEIAREAARVQLGLGEARTVYLYMGHIKPYKGVEDLIETFITIRDDASRLLIVGKPLDDEIGNRVRNLAASDRRIVLELCYVPDDRVQVFMNAADVVVFPFQKIHTSGSILLAMSFGKPVIAPAIASIPEYVNGQSGILFEPTDPEALRAALMSARGRDLAAMGKAGYERVAGRSWAEFASCHAEVYAGLRSPRP
jgi:beta-1,4-mannosyltransferase